tara:strand:- start:865 stop:1353 length:489 start_codon:yes stop_codon:yes gene_type:complete
MKNISVISATSGNNLILATKIEELLDLKSQIVSLEDYQLPLYTGNFELKNQTMINDLCQKIINADGFIFCGPEYNGGSAPILTNAITWISVTTDHWKDAFRDKIGLIATHSGGNGDSFLLTFRHQLEFLGVVVYPDSIKVNKTKPFDVNLTRKIINGFQSQL